MHEYETTAQCGKQVKETNGVPGIPPLVLLVPSSLQGKNALFMGCFCLSLI